MRNAENVGEVLQEIKVDISKVNSQDGLNNEIEIGKLKIDIIKLKEIADDNIEKKKKDARINKAGYKAKRDTITNIYYGTQNSYNNERSNLQNLISAEYSSYISDANRVNVNPNLGTGYKEQYRSQRYNQYLNAIKPDQTQMSKLRQIAKVI